MEKDNRPTIIAVPYGNSSRLAKHFGVTVQAVRNALKFVTDSELARSIRREALANYAGREKKAPIKI